MPNHRVIRSDSDRQGFIRFVGTVQTPMTFRWRKGEDRSIDQNALQWMWAGEAASQTGESADQVQRRWKYLHGCPILCADDAEFLAFCQAALSGLNHEQRIEAMKFVDVTRNMSVPQMSKYLDAVYDECTKNGIQLTLPPA